MNSKLLIGFVAVVIIVVVGLVVLGGSKNQTQTSPANQSVEQPTTTSQAQSQQQQNQQQVTTLTITADNSGFSPVTLTVKSGIRVIWANKSGSDISVNSAEHPTHRLFPELNLGHIPNDSNGSLVFDKPGTYNYHDHYSPSHTGTVVVE